MGLRRAIKREPTKTIKLQLKGIMYYETKNQDSRQYFQEGCRKRS